MKLFNKLFTFLTTQPLPLFAGAIFATLLCFWGSPIDLLGAAIVAKLWWEMGRYWEATHEGP